MKTFIVRFTVEDNELAQLRKRGMKDSAIRIALLDAGHYELQVLAEKQEADDLGMNAGEYQALLDRKND